MVKKAREKQRGLQRFFVQKHKVRLGLDAKLLSIKITSESAKKISEWAQKTWSYLSKICTQLNLLPFQANSNGLWVLCPTGRVSVHYILVACFLSVVARQLFVSLSCLADDGFNPTSIICLCVFMFSAASAAGGIGSSYTPTEIMALLNSWGPNVKWLEEEGGNELSVFGDTSDNVKVIGTALGFYWMSSEIAVATIFVTDAPVTVYVFLQSLGFDPGSSNIFSALPVFVWPILCFPFELSIALGPASVLAFNVCCGVLSLRLLRMHCHEMR